MEIVQEKNKRTGWIITIVFHTILVCLFAIYGLSYLDPPPEPEGITINFGTTDLGKMTENTETPTKTKEIQTEETVVNEVNPTESVEEDILTQNTEEAPVVKTEEEKEEVKEVVEEAVEEKKADQRTTDALNKWEQSQNTASGGDGETDVSGDQGALDGDKNSDNYKGGGAGNGLTFSLSGRSMISSPQIQDASQEVGKVVVDIIVDRSGKVLRATPGARGSTTTSTHLYKKAKDAALKTKFNANTEAAEEQKGQMTFIFILN